MQDWAVLIRDHHPGFITWEQYEANLKVLAGNRRPAAGEGGGALREGAALLQGLIRCGKCSRIMRTRYSGGKPGKADSCPRHECVKAKLHFGTDKICQSIGGRKVENLVLDQLFQVLESASLAATAQAMSEAETLWRTTSPFFETAPASTPNGPCANTTPSNPRTAWSPAPWNGHWKIAAGVAWPGGCLGRPNRSTATPSRLWCRRWSPTCGRWRT
jgi:hypothetical protein